MTDLVAFRIRQAQADAERRSAATGLEWGVEEDAEEVLVETSGLIDRQAFGEERIIDKALVAAGEANALIDAMEEMEPRMLEIRDRLLRAQADRGAG